MSRAIVIIVTHNSAEDLQRRSSDLSGIACDEWFDLFFIDNNSEDNTLEVCSLIPEAHLVENSENVGFAKAVNQGFRHIDGNQFFVLLNPDLSIDVESLRKVITYLDNNLEISICSPSIVNEDGVPQGFWAVNPGLISMLVRDVTISLYKYIGWMRRRYGTLDGSDVCRKLTPGYICGACFAARACLLDEVGLFDERFFLYAEDHDFCLRSTEAGFKIGIVTEVKAVHNAYGSSVTRESAWRMLYRSRYLFLRKHYGPFGEYAVRVADIASGLVRWALASIFRVIAGQRTKVDFNSARVIGKVMVMESIRSVSK